MYTCAPATWYGCLWGPWEIIRSPWSWSYRKSWAAQHGCCKLKTGLVGQEQALLSTEQFWQPWYYIFSTCSPIHLVTHALRDHLSCHHLIPFFVIVLIQVCHDTHVYPSGKGPFGLSICSIVSSWCSQHNQNSVKMQTRCCLCCDESLRVHSGPQSERQGPHRRLQFGSCYLTQLSSPCPLWAAAMLVFSQHLEHLI